MIFVKNLDESSSKKITSIIILIFLICYSLEFILFYNKNNIESKRQEYFKNYLKQNKIPFEKRDKYDVYLETKKGTLIFFSNRSISFFENQRTNISFKFIIKY